ncbi:MAG: transporter substrate-binding domain-containing protein [Clostridia bacterium]|nr:transporter substrate-binding domain-containing protein [Clostridia bacterium]
MKRILALLMAVATLLSLTLVFASCDPAATTDDAKPSESKGEASESTEGEGKTVVVGYTIYEPMNYKDESGKLVGFDTELAEAVFAKLGYKVIFKEISWDQKYTEVNAGTINCIWNGFTANSADDDGIARSEKVDFSYNYMRNKQVIVAKSALADTITDASSLKGKVGAVETGSAGDSFLGDNLEGAIKNGVTSQLDAMKELTMGTADFVVVDDQLAKAYVGKGDYADMKIVETVTGTEEFYAIGFKKGDTLKDEVNGALEALAADGTIAALATKYGVSNTAITDFADQK